MAPASMKMISIFCLMMIFNGGFANPVPDPAIEESVCSGPPPSLQFGNWSCNSSHSRCHLSCSPGYLSTTTTAVKCQDGVWPKNSNHFCEPSVLFLAGGFGGKQDTEIITQPFNEEEAMCQHTPPLLTEWSYHTSFYYSLNKEIFLCGGGEFTESKCSSITATATSWTDHALPSSIGIGVRSVIDEEEKKVIFVGGLDSNSKYLPATSLSLPMSSQPALTPVPNLSYRGTFSCVTSLHDSSFLILGGTFEGDARSNVTRYTFLDHSYTTLKNMIVPRIDHACATVNIDGKSFVVVAGGYTSGVYDSTDSSEIMDINENQWTLLDPLQEKRAAAGMMVTSSGLLVIGGEGENFEDLQSIERWDSTNRSWVTTERKLEKGRRFFGITEIPASFFQCKRDIEPATTVSTTEPTASTTEPEGSAV